MGDRSIKNGFFTIDDLKNFNVRHLDAATMKPLHITGGPELVEELNDLLRGWVKTKPEFFSNSACLDYCWSKRDAAGKDTHRARLVEIEEIK